jgi:hypothetical protein
LINTPDKVAKPVVFETVRFQLYNPEQLFVLLMPNNGHTDKVAVEVTGTYNRI